METADPTAGTRDSTSFYSALALDARSEDSLWQQLRSGFTLTHETDNPRVRKWLEWYEAHPSFLTEANTNARHWLAWVTQRVKARGMPAELALLPFVESAYDPSAHNPAGSAGMWQFMPKTGAAMGLARTGSYDGRLNVIAATDAALSYLNQQAQRWYDGDWKLALAAYNAGPGTVNGAIREAERHHRPTDYWHLDLPTETMNYVPQLMALSAIVSDPERYGITLPDVPARPEFAQVNTNGQINLSRAAQLADISEQRLRALNPAYKRELTRPEGNPPLLIPADRVDTFRQRLAQLTPSERLGWHEYRVSSGDTLSAIAARHDSSVGQLKSHNRMSSTRLQVGQTLMVPGKPSTGPQAPRERTIQVREGESLWSIAQRHDVGVARLARWNDLRPDATLKPGQQLTLY
ncbi:LysM peptidoglycan-binding domain-containing protein [Kushneria sinocarnis]|nr:LysM peptidoglycan-binding domain-containing protein [Kushneria sinocarnis]